MKRFSFFEDVLEREEQKKRLKFYEDLWGDSFWKNQIALEDGIKMGLEPIISQLKSILQREHLDAEEIGFDVRVYRGDGADMLQVHYLFLTHNLWFDLYKPGDNSHSVISIHDLGSISTLPEDIKNYGRRRASMIAGDVAREGIPKDMKSVIGEIKRGLSYIDAEFDKAQ